MAENDLKWPALKKLQEMETDLPRQREFLRLHEESGFTAGEQEEIDFREKLDRELGRIMRRELILLVNGDAARKRKREEVPHFRRLLEHSPAFVQYLNFYLYFGVRFAAGRLFDPCEPRPIADSDCNEPRAALPSPPICPAGWKNDGAIGQFLLEVRRDQRRSAGRNNPRLMALRFLDGFTGYATKGSTPNPLGNEERCFELWLRRLFVDKAGDESLHGYFTDLATGLQEWVNTRYRFYTDLETRSPAKAKWVEEWRDSDWREGRWTVNNPIAARCALVDFYWLAKILRADVSARGAVKYQGRSWLHFLAIWAATDPDSTDEVRAKRKAEFLRQEEVLRCVFGYVCDMIQNAVEIADECEDYNADPDSFVYQPRTVKAPIENPALWKPETWRSVEDREHREIRVHRKERQHDSAPGPDESARQNCAPCAQPPGWSRRVWTGDQVDNLVGLAFSGGGIRSATFNLGVLQRLQQLDLLRRVDYLSTVSGGGYIGAWLVGNVRRTRYWLSRMTSWDESIEYLRQYSNYLAPHNGILSADSWSVWLTWIRNAFLIQLTGFVWLAAILMAVLLVKRVFIEWVGAAQPSGWSTPHLALAICMLTILAILMFFLWQPRIKKESPLWGLFRRGNGFAIVAACGSWVGSFLSAGLLWGQAVASPEDVSEFSKIFQNAARGWSPLILSIYPFAFGLMAAVTVKRPVTRSKLFGVIATIVLVPAVSYLTLCGQLRIYGLFLSGTIMSGTTQVDGLTFTDYQQVSWLAFSFGPALTMLAIALGVVVFIGLLGRSAPDWTREWWTRYGAWISLVGALCFLLDVAAVFAPLGMMSLAQLKWTSVSAAAGWIGSVISGLLAGKSSKTGEGGQRSQALELVARIGGLIFIVGAIALCSTLVYLVLTEALANDSEDYWVNLQAIVESPWMWLILPVTALVGMVFSKRFDLNTFSLNQFYRNRLVRCYLGATRWQPGKRKPHPFTAFDEDDDIFLADMRIPEGNERRNERFCDENFRGPFPIVNCTLNLGGSSDLSVHTRQSASFAVTPLFGGASRKKVGYAPTVNDDGFGFAGGLKLGQAISVSGAAASPNMGYNTSPLVSFMMTLFNVRLGWWFPNPAQSGWYKDSPPSGKLLLSELSGLATENRDFVNISDGGHFENLGVYELIRRRARVIIAADAECDESLTFGSLGNLIRICQTDFGADIDLDVTSIRQQEKTAVSRAHCAVGRITYSNGTHGYLIYIKSSITGDEDVGVAQYRSGHSSFPHESTSNQFYSEDQFEAYRRLGEHITERTFRDAEDEDTPFDVAAKLFDVWAPAGFSTEAFIHHSQTFAGIWDKFRTDRKLEKLFKELTGSPSQGALLHPHEHSACMQLLQLMENVFLDLRLDDFWDHPDNRGWAMLFTGFARSLKFRESWNLSRNTYGIRFEYFCNRHLGLDRDRPVMRV